MGQRVTSASPSGLHYSAGTAGVIFNCLSLPDTVVMSETVNQFKNRLDKFWSNQDLIYKYKAELTGVGNRSSIGIVSIFAYLSVLYDVDIESSACILSSRYAMLCLGEVVETWKGIEARLA